MKLYPLTQQMVSQAPLFLFWSLLFSMWVNESAYTQSIQSARGMVNIIHMCATAPSFTPAHRPMYHNYLCRQRNRGTGQSCSYLIAELCMQFLHRSFLGHLSKLSPQWPERKVGLWWQRDKKIWTLKDTWFWKWSKWPNRLGLLCHMEGNHLSSLFFCFEADCIAPAITYTWILWVLPKTGAVPDETLQGWSLSLCTGHMLITHIPAPVYVSSLPEILHALRCSAKWP